MKNKLFAVVPLGIFSLLFLLAGAVSAQEKNFAGSWNLDAAKSEGLPPGMNQEMTVTQTGDLIKIETKVTTDQGEQTVPDAYTLDGREKDFEPTFPGGAKGRGKRTATRTENGFEVMEKSSVETPEGTVTIEMKRRWQLSADGRQLIIELEIKGPQGEQKTKRTFTKA